MAKTLYHSGLVKMGPVQVTVKSEVLPSKFKDKPPYVVLAIGNEDFNYSTENDECAGFFEGQKGATFTLVAEGSRENAILTYVGQAAPEPPPEQPAKPPARKANRPPGMAAAANRPPATQQQPAQPPAAGNRPPAQQEDPAPPRTPKAPETPEEKLNRIKRAANRVANTWVVAYAAALHAKEQVREQLGAEVTQDQFQACVATIAVQLERDGMHHLMHTGGVDAKGFYAVGVPVGHKGNGHGAHDPAPATGQASDNDGKNV